MEKEKLSYIEETGLLFEMSGVTRMAGRIFGFLVICNDDAVSFDQIRKVLKASKGSISTNLKQLVQIGFIEPLSLPGDRKTYYRVSPVSVGDIMKARLSLMRKFGENFSKGHKLKSREDDVSQWLLESASFYAWMEDRIEELITRWEKEKSEFIDKMREKL